MALRRVSAVDVVRYFSGDDTILSEVFMEGGDDDLGMEDVYSEWSDKEIKVTQRHSHMQNLL